MQPVRATSLQEITQPVRRPSQASALVQRVAERTQTVENSRKMHFERVFKNEDLKKEFRGFLENVLYQLDVEKFEALISEVMAKDQSYDEMYTELLSRIGEAKKGTFSQLKALSVIKKVLTSQIQKLIAPKAKIDGYMEIGYPGRLMRPLQKAGLTLTGKKIVVGYPPKMTDYIEAGFPRPNNQFVAIGNYEPITGVEKNSLDLAVCPIGLHHIPESGLKAFVDSISDVLKEGGSFILRDHDVKNQNLDAIANVAHSVFNAATGETLKSELSEERHFKAIEHFTDILKASGFEREEGSFVQEGDPSKNTLVRFTKKVDSAGGLDRAMRLSSDQYEREQLQTYMTTLEWHLVHEAKEYADFLQDHKGDASRFPYFSHIGVLAKGFFDSVRDGMKASGVVPVLRSEYMLMSLFMLCTTSVELYAKGIQLLPLRLLSKPESFTAVSKQYTKIQSDYAEFIKTVPFYEFDFIGSMKSMVRAFLRSEKSLSSAYLTAVSVSELALKAAISKPLNMMYKGTEPGFIHLVIEKPQGAIAGVEVVKESEKHAVIKVGRYLPFRELLTTFAEQDVQIESIAGQKRIQVKVKVDSNQDFSTIDGVKVLSEMKIPTENGSCYKRLDIEVKKLSKALKALQENGCEITYIHDF